MATHHCIGNPCWICFPNTHPKPKDKFYDYFSKRVQDYSFKENNISTLLEEMLIQIFQSGIDEDEHFRCNEEIF